MSKHKEKRKCDCEEEEEEEDDDAELTQQLNAAAVKVKHKNPHSESGRAKLPRSMRSLVHDKQEKVELAKSKKPVTKDLFADDSSSESSDDDKSDNKGNNEGRNGEKNRAAKENVVFADRKHEAVNTHNDFTPINKKDCMSKENVEVESALKINKQYAEKYEEVKRKKELHQLTEKYGKKLKNVKIKSFTDEESFSDSESNMGEDDSDEENDDEEDDEAVLLTDDNELAFAKALIAVRKAVAFNAADTDDNNNKNSKNGKVKSKHDKSNNSEANSREENKHQWLEEECEQPNGENRSGHSQSSKELFVKASFFPPVETQIERNTRIFNEAMAAKRERKRLKFKLADEYRRAVQLSGSTDVENDAESNTVNHNESNKTTDHQTLVLTENEDGINADDNGNQQNEDRSVAPKRSLPHKLYPQSAEEKNIREAFLSNVQESTAGFEITAAHTKSKNKNSAIFEQAQNCTTKDEKRRLLEEAFSIKPKKVSVQNKEKLLHLSKKSNGNETNDDSESDDDDDDGEAFIRDFFVNELWRPENNNNNNNKNHNYNNSNGDSNKNDENNENLYNDTDSVNNENINNESKYTIEQLAQEEADEVFYQNAELWEREFQEKKYRHEEEHELAGQIRSFPRLQGNAAASEGLLRKLDTSRKDARERRKVRLLEERQRQVEELKRLKHLKRREIEEQRALIASVAGLQMPAMSSPSLEHVEGNVEHVEHAKKEKKRTVSNENDKNATIHSNNNSSSNNRNKNSGVAADGAERTSESHMHVSNDEEEESDKEKATTKKHVNPLESKLKAIWSEQDLDAPYDAAEFDKKMAMLFDEDYYDETNVDEKEIAYIEAELDNELDNENDISFDDENEDVTQATVRREAGNAKMDKHSNKVGENGSKERTESNMSTLANSLEVPELFTVDNLEEAKEIVQRKETQKRAEKNGANHSTSTHKTSSIINKNQHEKVSGGIDSFHNLLSSFERQKKSELESEGRVLSEKESPGNKLSNFDRTTSDSILSNPVALLYPELVLKEIEKVSFEQKRALNMIENMTAKHETGSKEENNCSEDRSEETLRQLQVELKQKEQEYNDLHHQILSEHGSPSHSSKQSGGSMPFRYRSVPPEDFTLSVEEILARDDRQLNMIAPMSCYAAYLDKYSNRRDRAKIERLRRNGFREIDAERHSRRYGDVSKTAILDPSTMSAEEGEAVAERLRKRLRSEEEEENNQNWKRERTSTDNNNSMNSNYKKNNFVKGNNYDNYENNYQGRTYNKSFGAHVQKDNQERYAKCGHVSERKFDQRMNNQNSRNSNDGSMVNDSRYHKFKGYKNNYNTNSSSNDKLHDHNYQQNKKKAKSFNMHTSNS